MATVVPRRQHEVEVEFFNICKLLQILMQSERERKGDGESDAGLQRESDWERNAETEDKNGENVRRMVIEEEWRAVDAEKVKIEEQWKAEERETKQAEKERRRQRKKPERRGGEK